MRGLVVSAFPATGKTTLARTVVGVADHDSTPWPRDESWPGVYVDSALGLAETRSIVLVSSHREVRAALRDRGAPYLAARPRADLLDEYAERMIRRGSALALVGVVRDNWWPWLADMDSDPGCDHLVLGPGRYLSDVLR